MEIKKCLYIHGEWFSKEQLKPIRHIQYRGLLDYCNFSCSYCPFSKRAYSKNKEQQDQEALVRLFHQLKKERDRFTFQIVPYGEALLFPYYWEFLARISLFPQVPALGCQTNTSFSIEKMETAFLKQKGNLEKLRLWCTFHPSMVSVETFLCQIEKLRQYPLELCVGAVANPLEKESILQLASMLPKDIYFWLNQMDGRKKVYTLEDRIFFESIDPLFFLEEAHISADANNCSCKDLFIEANGDFSACNISNIPLGNIYKETIYKEKIYKEKIYKEKICQKRDKKCIRKECSCFLAYQHRFDKIPELALFFPYPAFRIIKHVQAAFFDIDYDDAFSQEKEIKNSDRAAKILKAIGSFCNTYFISSLPYAFAAETFQKISSCLPFENLLEENLYLHTHIIFFKHKEPLSEKQLLSDWQQEKTISNKKSCIMFICKKMRYSLHNILIYGKFSEYRGMEMD